MKTLLRRTLILGLAVAFHAAALNWALASPTLEDSGDAEGDGFNGLEVGLGQAGSFADSIKKLGEKPAEPDVKPEPPKPQPPEPPKPVKKPEPVKPKPDVVKKPKQPEPVVAKAPPIPVAETPVAPEATYQVAQAEAVAPQPAEVAQPASAPVPVNAATATDAKPAAASDAQVKGSGRGDHKSAGGKAGKGKNYISQLMRWLNQYQVYPTTARKNKQEGVVKLQFSINRKGEVLSARIYQSSGHPELDNAALDMLKAASPLPEVPDDFYPGRDQLPLVIPVEYSLITNNSYKD